jgi:hypothetical protein
VTVTVADAVIDAAIRELGVPADAIVLALRLVGDAENYPLLGAPSADSVKIYLDVKDWVALAKARLGRPATPADQVAYETLQAATSSGDAVVVMTATTYIEVVRIGSLRQRTDLANVITEIGGFVSINGRSTVVDHQVRTALSHRFPGPTPDPIPVFGLGVSFAFGDMRRLAVRRTDGQPIDLPIAEIRKVNAVGNVLGDYYLLRGPAPEEIADLRARGYQPEAIAQIEADRVDRERELAAMLAAGTARRDHLGDIVAGRHMYWELLPHLQDALGDYGVTVEEFFAQGKEWLKDFLDDVPSAAITVTLSEKGFRNSYKKWTGNDLRDGDAMSAAIPQCDVVLTDRYVTAQLATSPAVARQAAVVLANLADLTAALPGLVSGRAVK